MGKTNKFINNQINSPYANPDIQMFLLKIEDNFGLKSRIESKEELIQIVKDYESDRNEITKKLTGNLKQPMQELNSKDYIQAYKTND